MRSQALNPNAPAGRAHHRRVWMFVAVLALLALLAASAALNRFVASAVSEAGAVIATHPVAGAVIFTALATVSAMLAFFSSAIIVPLGVQQWGPALTGALLLCGWVSGGMAAYLVGRFLGEPVVRRLVKPEHVRFYEDRIGHRTPFGVILLFQSVAPAEITGYVLGMARYPFGAYVAGRTLSELPYAVGAVLLGEQFLRGHYGLMLVAGVCAIALIAWALNLLHRLFVAPQVPLPGPAAVEAARSNPVATAHEQVGTTLPRRGWFTHYLAGR